MFFFVFRGCEIYFFSWLGAIDRGMVRVGLLCIFFLWRPWKGLSSIKGRMDMWYGHFGAGESTIGIKMDLGDATSRIWR